MAQTREPEIWLQDREDRGMADCGCELVQNYDGSGAAFFYCNTHAAAPHMLEALKTLVEAHDEDPPMLTDIEWEKARAALAEAESPPPLHGCTPSERHPGLCAECGEPLVYPIRKESEEV
jgi:hypothetical protein